MGAQELAARLANSRMDDRFEPFERLWIAEHRLAEAATINSGRAGAAGECGLNLGDKRSLRPLQVPDDGIGVEHGHAKFGEHRSDRGLAHSYRPGEPRLRRLLLPRPKRATRGPRP